MARRMGSLSDARIIVVGAGALGLACAAALAARGGRVTVVDDAAGALNASAVAAGMISPGLEAALEDADAGRAGLYRFAAGLWPQFAQRHDVELVRDGADWRGPPEPLAARLEALGFAFDETSDGLFLPGESRVSPRRALDALGRGLERVVGRAVAVEGSRVRAGADWLVGDAVVLAAGWQCRDLTAPGLEPLLALIRPVKGQLIVLDGAGAVARSTRDESVYLVPADDGVIAGATMEPGASDTSVDPGVVERLRAAAAGLEPSLAGAPVRRALAGVRGATPDGLPLAGATAVEGVYAALAPRRNGWLLAPLVAETVAAAIAQEPPPPFADRLSPGRFDPD